MIALADRRQIHCYYVQDTCCDTSLDVIDSKHGTDHIQVLNYAALNQLELEAVRPCSI